ncbi:MAG TPA: 3' terminal RNA ribose 2'-O-methyltransferase Hen1 [Longimicrobiaceae bacterium]|nr:3' terminal RNA ribose 2'-O-methyltransferase Hen1 [Longimicrobiaceae bacterium]
MLLTIRTTHRPATDLGYLLAKHPERVQSFDLGFGYAHVFYPEAGEDACTAALLLDVDPVGLVRGAQGALDQYVNDRPYVSSSFLSVALSRVLRSALAGQSRERPELAETPIPLRATLAVLPCRGGEDFLRRLWEPLGYAVDAVPHPLDEREPAWGASRYFTVTLTAVKRLAELLSHLYVLVPVLDNRKHYWVGDDEVEKLLRHGEGWLAAHPERSAITRRYLRHRSSLVRQAIARLVEEEDPDEEEETPAQAARDAEEERLERPVSLNEQRLSAVLAAVRASGARRVLDLGCGEGKLLRRLLEDRSFTEIVGMDVAHRSLEIARDRLKLDRLPPKQRERIKLMHGSLMYRDRRLEGFDAATVVEVVEHMDPPRLAAFERVLWEHARPGTIVLTTPNGEYNVRWPSLPAGDFRHRDHRFEWTRAELRAWAEALSARTGYAVRFLPVGPEDPEVGSPTQMAIFTRP